ncbi:hypothetical protein ANCCAN_20950, partial [Ancylostoma caninum]
GRFHAVDDAARAEWVEEPRPTFLRRTPQFYDKCDLCAFKIMRTGDYCPACGRPGTSMRPDTQANDSSSYPTEQDFGNSTQLLIELHHGDKQKALYIDMVRFVSTVFSHVH